MIRNEYIDLTEKRIQNKFAKNEPTYQTPQGQPVTKTETPQRNVLVWNVNTITMTS